MHDFLLFIHKIVHKFADRLGIFSNFPILQEKLFFLSVIDDFQMIVVEKDTVHERVDEFPAPFQLPDVYLSEIA